MANDLNTLLARARDRWNSMSPREKEQMLASQCRSYVIAEVGFGSDRDEADYAAAVAAGDRNEIQRLRAEAEKRMAVARRLMAAEQTP